MSTVKEFVSFCSAVNSDFFPADKSVAFLREFVSRRDQSIRDNCPDSPNFYNLKLLEEDFRQAFHAEESPFKVSNCILKVFLNYQFVPEFSILTVKGVFFGLKLYFVDIDADEEVFRFFREKLVRRLRELSMELIVLVSDFFGILEDQTKPTFADMAAKATQAISNFPTNKREVKAVLQFAGRFDLYEAVDVDVLLENAAAMDLWDETFHFAKSQRNVSVKLLSLMVPSKNSKHMKQLIKAHDLDTQAFPQLFEFLRYGFFRFAVNEVGFEVVEEAAALNPADLPPFIRYLWHAKLRDQAYSVYSRHKDTIDLTFFDDTFANPTSFTYASPTIRTRDDFLPTSLINGTSPLTQYFTLAELAYDEDQVTFVTKTNFDDARDAINAASAVGIDSEFFAVDCSGFHSSELATIQIAISSRIFVFDCIDLKGSFKLTYFVHQLLKNPDILKIVLGFESDLKVFQAFFKTPKGFELANIVNLEQLEKQGNRPGLAALCEKYLLKKLCKKETMSAWNQRPLRRAQLHYAALDAAILLRLYDVMAHKDRLLFTPEKTLDKSVQPKVSPFAPDFQEDP